jgi:hypothetical protein
MRRTYIISYMRIPASPKRCITLPQKFRYRTQYVSDAYVGTKYHLRCRVRRTSIIVRIRIRYLRSTPSPKRAHTMALENLAGDKFYPLVPGMQLSGLSATNESSAIVIVIFLCQDSRYSSEGSTQLDQNTFPDEYNRSNSGLWVIKMTVT